MRRLLLGWSLVFALACSAAAPLRPTVVAPARASLAAPHKAADHERALALSNAGDATLKLDVDGAIEKYLQALRLEPDNVDVLWKLSRAYDKKEDWEQVVVTLAHASRLAPQVPWYARWQGKALVELGRSGKPGAYEAAREPLSRCLVLDPKLAECVFLLGEVEEWTDHAQAAAERYTQALRLEPSQPQYYRALAALYRVFKQANEAERVLVEGMAQLQPIPRNRPALARMSVSLAQLSAARDDQQAWPYWLAQAETYFDEGSPEVAYEIGSIYAAASAAPVTGTGVSHREQALRILSQFIKRTCHGSAAAKFKEQCELSSIMIQMLGLDAPVPRAKAPAGSPPAPVPLLPGMPTPKLEMRPQRAGDAYTVWGAAYALRSRQHRQEVTDKPIAITGYVVKTNLCQAPRCAVHRAGIADPEHCRADIPAFWLGDRPTAAEADCIKVMGFASTYAQLFEAIKKADSSQPDEPYPDTFWGQTVPNPLPAAGARLTVRGNYGLTFAKASSGAESDPIMGILDFAERDVLEEAPELETLPGVKRRRR